MPDNSRLDQLVQEAKEAADELRTTLQPKLQELGAQVKQTVEEGLQKLSDKLDEIRSSL